jgi:hypothetical protein
MVKNSTYIISLNPYNNPGKSDYSHFSYEKTEDQGDSASLPSAHNEYMIMLGLRLQLFQFQVGSTREYIECPHECPMEKLIT